MFQSTGILSNLFIDLFGTKVKWLTSTKIAPYSMILVNVWKMTGYYMIIFIAGLLNVPNTFYEAARVDGANYFERLIYITLPQMKNTFILVACAPKHGLVRLYPGSQILDLVESGLKLESLKTGWPACRLLLESL